MANNEVVGILRAMLTMDTGQFEAGSKRAIASEKQLETQTAALGQSIAKLTPQAERMVKAFSGDKLLYSANSLVSAIAKIGGATKLTEAEQAKANKTLSEALAKYALMGQQPPKAMVELEKATRGVTTATSAMTAGMSLAAKQSAASINMIGGMSQAGRQAAASMVSVEKPVSFLTTRMVALGAATGTFFANLAFQGVRTLVSFGREAFSTAGRLTDLADKTGLSTETIQRMDFVAKQTSTSLDSMTNAAFRLGVQIAGGNTSVERAVGRLGLSFTEIQKMRPDQQFETIVGALSKMENQQERNRIGVLLFGRQFAEIAASVEQGYADIAKGASVSSDAQLRALDKAADRWGKFVSNTKTNITAFLGNVILLNDELRRIEQEQGGRPNEPGRSSKAALEELERRMALGLVGARREDIKLTEEQAEAKKNYAKQLADVQKELGKLSAADRQEIAAAQALGVANDELESQYDLTAGALGVLNTQTKDYEKNLKKVLDQFSGSTLLKDAREYESALNSIGGAQALTAEEGETYLKMIDAIIGKYSRFGPAGAEVVAHFTTVRDQLSQTDAAALRYLANEKLTADGERVVMAARDDMARAYLESEQLKLNMIAAIDAAGLTHLENEKRTLDGERLIMQARDDMAIEFMKLDQQRMDALKGTKLEDPFSKWAEQGKQQRQRVIQMWKGIGTQIESASISRMGSLFFGQFGHDVTGELKAAADEAELDFLRIQRSGKATAHELETAFTRWREAQDRASFDFSERFSQWMGGIKQTFVGVLDDMLQHFVRNFLGGLIKGLSSAKLSQAFGNILAGGGAGAALGGGASFAASSVAGVESAALGGGAGIGGGSLAALATNPWTIGAAGAVALGLAIAKGGLFRGGQEALKVSPRRDQFFGQLQAMFGGSQFEAAQKALAKAKVTGPPAERLIGAIYKADTEKAYDPAQAAFLSALMAGGVKNVRPFNMGGFVPPGVVQPAILHGGAFGEDIIPRTSPTASTAQSPRILNLNMSIQAWDSADVKRALRRDALPEIKRWLELNTDGLRVDVQKAAAT